MAAAGPRPNAVACTAAVGACGTASRWEHALALLGLIDRPDALPFNAALTACGRAARWEQALALLGLVARAALEPTAVTSSAALLALLAGGRLQEAMGMYRQDVETGSLPDPWKGDRVLDLHGLPTEVALVAVMAALADALCVAPRTGGLDVVTGRGLHSPGGEAVVAPAVRTLLLEELQVQIASGSESPLGRARLPVESLRGLSRRYGTDKGEAMRGKEKMQDTAALADVEKRRLDSYTEQIAGVGGTQSGR
ncbi:unnamed protein product [Prorocentrum cordatum]|uniref:Smr domain-containing protein n=1 Tax=Prorocentrum cordatum TaxID=2364126 RepID=A0ABN9Q299_9DINO|nr:unnamed protein product [Polarella glacialis]